MNEPTDINLPHGLQQNIKMELLGLIHSGENPFHIICRLAEYLEEVSAEPGYAKIVKDNIRSIYGIGLGETPLLEDELQDVVSRGGKLKAAYEQETESAEVKKRIEFALISHRKRAEQLQHLLTQAKSDPS